MIIPEEYTIHKPKNHLLKIINEKTFNDKFLYEKESNFHNIKVIENEIGRFLHYNDTYQAGFIKTDFYEGNLPYINYFLLPYFYKHKINKILLIGLGSGKIINDLYKLYPNIRQFDIVDIEENIFDIAQKYFGFKKRETTSFQLQDAIAYLKMSHTKYDLIIVDVANNNGIDERFLEDEYLQLINSHLKKSGIFVSNLCTSPDINNKNNKLFNKIKELYSTNFKHNDMYLGNYSDKIYYKTFFNIDERVIDITNLIIISSKNALKYSRNIQKDIDNFTKIFPKIDIKSIIQDKIT